MGFDFGADGTLYFTDLGNNRVRMIDSRGLVQTVAGNGDLSSIGDEGRATSAGLHAPIDIAFGPDASIYISTHGHGSAADQRIRIVDRDGIITTFAGNGGTGYSGDGGPAIDAELNIPCSVVIGPGGNLYIADADNNVIRMVEVTPPSGSTDG